MSKKSTEKNIFCPPATRTGIPPLPSRSPPPLLPSKCSKMIFSRLITASAFISSNSCAYPRKEKKPFSRCPVPMTEGSFHFPVTRSSIRIIPSSRSNTSVASRMAVAGTLPSRRTSRSPAQDAFPATRRGFPAVRTVPLPHRIPSEERVIVIPSPVRAIPPSRTANRRTDRVPRECSSASSDPLICALPVIPKRAFPFPFAWAFSRGAPGNPPGRRGPARFPRRERPLHPENERLPEREGKGKTRIRQAGSDLPGEGVVLLSPFREHRLEGNPRKGRGGRRKGGAA